MIYLPVEDRYMSAELIYKRWKNGESIYFLDAESNSPAKIENILFREEVVPVYNLHVSSVYDRNNSHIDTTLPNHNYMANGIVVHNRKAPNTFDDAVSLYNAYKNRCTNV